VQSAPPVQVDPAANLRRSSIVGAALGVLSIVALSFAGHPLMGVFGCVGMGLGAFNNRLLQRSVITYATTGTMKKSQFRSNVLVRLGLITAIAFGIALLVRPDGLGVFVGLAVFQILMLIGASVPVFRSLRPS
jgi:cation transport ATPase